MKFTPKRMQLLFFSFPFFILQRIAGMRWEGTGDNSLVGDIIMLGLAEIISSRLSLVH